MEIIVSYSNSFVRWFLTWNYEQGVELTFNPRLGYFMLEKEEALELLSKEKGIALLKQWINNYSEITVIPSGFYKKLSEITNNS